MENIFYYKIKLNINYISFLLHILYYKKFYKEHKEERKEYYKEHYEKNKEERQKYAHRAKAFNNVFGSDKCKRTLGGISKRPNVDMNSDKVTNNSFNITHNAMILNRDENQQVPYYGRRHFITCNSGNGKGMTYL